MRYGPTIVERLARRDTRTGEALAHVSCTCGYERTLTYRNALAVADDHSRRLCLVMQEYRNRRETS